LGEALRYHPTAVEGAYLVEPEPRGDERGFFARLFDADEFETHGLASRFPQINNSLSRYAGTLRGLHYQIAPAGEAKLLRCVRGAVFDVVLDLRERSPTFGRWAGKTLTPANLLMMYVPAGCAHGFLTLEPDTEVIYLASTPYVGAQERIIRWNDPKFAIDWPRAPVVLSDKDRNGGDYDPSYHRSGY
jgi:dTDP-4-dehydrorhamnose 3,5-epimerase